MDGDMVDPPERDERNERDDASPDAADPAPGDASDAAGGVDEFDAIVGDLDLEADIADEFDSSEIDVPALLAEREEYKGMVQRIQAEFDNYRKRAAAQSLAEADRASGRLAEALLPVLDAAEAAFVRHPDEVGPLLNQMLVELKKHGLEALDIADQPFDPEFAEAVAHEPGDGGEPIVAEVLRSGYTWKGRTLRPAMVKTKD